MPDIQVSDWFIKHHLKAHNYLFIALYVCINRSKCLSHNIFAQTYHNELSYAINFDQSPDIDCGSAQLDTVRSQLHSLCVK